ncbi:uncharacterized protein [Clytia hemisphaerica]|uniref:uncharacterized protein n=1 Tax=Clytia hemisphaerica TaxID=252671 RepID=UPI0034D62662
MNGLVERKIREVKKSIQKSVSNQRLSIMQWETFASRAANSINDLPLGIRDYDGDLQSLDIITPNRLRLGRNNDRSPTGEFRLSGNSSKIILQNQAIFDSWFELWLTSHVPGLIAKPKWFKSDTSLKKGDVVLFTKQDSPIRSNYQFGMVESVEIDRDEKVRKVKIQVLEFNISSSIFYQSFHVPVFTCLQIWHVAIRLNIINQLQTEADSNLCSNSPTLRQMWLDNFKMMKDLGEVRFKRAIVPEDALNTDIHTLDFGDSSKSLICTCIYARFQRKNGSFSCQLVFARTRTVPKGLSLPRAELLAALINTHTGEVVRRSFGTLHKSSLKFTDSQIALHWISNDEKPLKLWVRNRVVEINRFKSKEDWFYIPTNNMIADLGTRRGATIADVSQDSKWMNGMDWMRLPSTEFPIKSAQDLKVTDSDIKEIDKERTILVHHASITPDPIQLAKQRYQFSKYLIDPNHRRFSITVRILAYVIRFCKSFISKWKQKKTLIVQTSKPLILSNEEIIRAEKYFYQKGTMEVQHFLPKSKYDKISQVKDNILMYTGRILPTTQVSVVGRYTDTMKDLTSTTIYGSNPRQQLTNCLQHCFRSSLARSKHSALWHRNNSTTRFKEMLHHQWPKSHEKDQTLMSKM